MAAGLDEVTDEFEKGIARKQLVADEGGLGVLVAAMIEHPHHSGVLEWASRALSVVTYERPPLREAALAAGARPQWLCGMADLMGGLKMHASPSKGRAAFTGLTGRPSFGTPPKQPPAMVVQSSRVRQTGA